MTELQHETLLAALWLAEMCEKHTEEHTICDGCALYWKKEHGQRECLFWHPEMTDYMPMHINDLLEDRGITNETLKLPMGAFSWPRIEAIDIKQITG